MKVLYNVCQRLYNKGFMLRRVWFFVYDRLHRKVDDQWGGIKRGHASKKG